MRITGAWLLIDCRNPHELHESPYAVTANLVPLSLQVTRYLAAAIIGCKQKLLINQTHQR